MKDFYLNAVSQPWTYQLRPGLNKIGRNPTNDFRIPDASVSSFHCEVHLESGRIKIRDLCSTNGTFINGAPVTDDVLEEGQTLQFGTVEFRLQTDPLKIAIPKSEPPPVEEHALLEDGKPACLHHPSAPATFRCPKCERTFCDQCIHALKLAGSKPRYYCPSCSTICLPLGDRASGKSKKKSFLGRLTQTIRLRLKV